MIVVIAAAGAFFWVNILIHGETHFILADSVFPIVAAGAFVSETLSSITLTFYKCLLAYDETCRFSRSRLMEAFRPLPINTFNTFIHLMLSLWFRGKEFKDPGPPV